MEFGKIWRSYKNNINASIVKKVIYPLISNYKYFIKIQPKQLFIQYKLRYLNWICKNKDDVSNNINKYILPQFKTIKDLTDFYKKDLNGYVKKYKYILYTSERLIGVINCIITN